LKTVEIPNCFVIDEEHFINNCGISMFNVKLLGSGANEF